MLHEGWDHSNMTQVKNRHGKPRIWAGEWWTKENNTENNNEVRTFLGLDADHRIQVKKIDFIYCDIMQSDAFNLFILQKTLLSEAATRSVLQEKVF